METEPEKKSLRSHIPWLSGTFHVIIASSLMGVMGVSLISPILPELRPAFGISDAEAGLVITTYALPGIFFTPVIGLLADRVGRKQLLIPLLFTYGVSGGAIAFTTNFAIVLVLRIFQGLGATALAMLAITLIGDIYEGTQRDALIGVNGSMIGIGAAFFPMVGGVLGGIGWNIPFLIYGVGILVGMFATVLVDEPTQNESRDDVRAYLTRLFAASRSPRALAIFAALFVTIFVFYGAVITALPLLLSDEFGLGPELIGPVLAVVSLSNAVTASQYGRISQLRSGPELAGLGFVAFGLGLLMVWIAPTILLISVGLLAFGVGVGLFFPSIDTIIITGFSEELRAGVMGLRTSMLRLGQTIGPIVFTGVAEVFFVETVDGYRVILFVAGVIVIGLGSIIYALLRR
jgi:ACDE family multidrug resistance protein